MIQVAIESIGKTGSLAILRDDAVLWHWQSDWHRQSEISAAESSRLEQTPSTASQFAVKLDRALSWCRDQALSIDTVSVASGPGSFTGLRIAITTAKTLAYALQLPVIPVGSLAAIAQVTARGSGDHPASRHSVADVLVGINAYRRQVFVARFSGHKLLDSDDPSDWIHRADLIERSEWDLRVKAAAREGGVVAGDDMLLNRQDPARPQSSRTSLAIGVGQLAHRLSRADRQAATVDAMTLQTNYIKASAAEEKARKP